MKILDLQQGSDAWHEFRRNRFTASDAAAVFGAHKYKSRDQLLDEAVTGETPEVTPQQQRLFDKGHAAEAAARPIAEEIIGEELYPATVEDDNQRMGASMDGLTMIGDIGWEHKLWSDKLAAHIRDVKAGKCALDDHYRWQLDHQMCVSGAERILFMCSDGTADKCEHVWYDFDGGREDKLLSGWLQFESDLAEYQPRERTEKAQAEATEQFPTLYLEIHGGVDNSNLPAFVDRATQYIESINTDLQTDTDFATAEQVVKDLEKAEKQIEIVKSQALAQTTSIEEAFREMDRVRESCRSKRLALQKLVKSEKENRKNAIIREAQDALHAELLKADDEFRPVRIEGINADFYGAAKGKRNLDSIQSACNDELARAKIALTEKRDHIRKSLQIIEEQAGDYQNLFHDRQQLIDLDHDHLALVVKQRIDEHKAAEQRRIEAEAQRVAEQQRREEERQQAEKLRATEAPEKPQEQRKPDPVRSHQSGLGQDARRDSGPIPRTVEELQGDIRPSDQEIIEVIATAFGVDAATAIGWLCEMDMSEAGEKLAVNA